MAFKIDPDAALLYKQLRPVQSAFKKVIQQQSAENIVRVLSSVFASTFERFSVTDKNYNTHEDLAWTSPIRALSIGGVFNAKLTIHLDDDANVTSADMQDQWIYGALLPLYLKTELHDAWLGILLHATKLLKEPTVTNIPLFNIWNETMLLENLGWISDEDDTTQISTISVVQAEVARHAMNALSKEPTAVIHAWPNLAPWLTTMQVLSTVPDSDVLARNQSSTTAWQEWSYYAKKMHLTSGLSNPLELPLNFAACDSVVP